MDYLNARLGAIFNRGLVNVIIAFSATLFCCSTFAQSETIAFESLSPEVQDTLSPFADNWDKINLRRQKTLVKISQEADPDMRKRIKRHANHWKGLPKEERKKVRKTMRKFENLPPHKREKLRQHWNNMPAEKRRIIDRTFDHYEQLPAQKQNEIREKVRSMSPQERREVVKEIKRQIDRSETAKEKGRGKNSQQQKLEK